MLTEKGALDFIRDNGLLQGRPILIDAQTMPDGNIKIVVDGKDKLALRVQIVDLEAQTQLKSRAEEALELVKDDSEARV